MAVSARDSKLLEQIQNLLAQVDYLTKKLFGTSSEKMKDVEGQLNLFDEAEQEADVDLKAPVIKVSEHTRKKNVLLRSFLKVRFQKGSSMITAIRQYRESSSVQSFLSTSADYGTRSTHLSREKPIVLKKKNRYSTRSGAGLTSRSHVREAVSRQR